ncbi:GNAT family N-acetyltransferase [Desertivirga brevis]|uniref:GNAT family N-acetyltransferase n=1 Tax=Desertivirga brevis TaxID=2810310 RepID=UPI001A967797|nr:GNAT family N-acetyltransferase [Pedobacter sp. SYSU D00873]
MQITSPNSRSRFSTKRGTIEDMPLLQELYVDTIKDVCKNEYSEEQRLAWAKGVENNERWNRVFEEQFVILAMDNNLVAGFASLDKGVYIDMFYVHKDFQRQGVASFLYSIIEQQALAMGTKRLTADISKTAKPFFELKGFKIDTEQTFPIRGVMISNFRMSKVIG